MGGHIREGGELGEIPRHDLKGLIWFYLQRRRREAPVLEAAHSNTELFKGMFFYNAKTNTYFYISDDEDDRSRSWEEVELRWVKQSHAWQIWYTSAVSQVLDSRERVRLCP